MSLKLRLFLLIGGLVAVLIGAEAWLVKRLASDLTRGVEGVALGVSESMLTTFRAPAATGPADAPFAHGVVVHERTFTRHPAPDAPDPAERVVAVPRSPIAVIATEPPMTEEALLALVEAVHGGDDPAKAVADAGATGFAQSKVRVELAPGAPRHARVLRVVGPEFEKRIPIPDSGLDDALASFLQRLLLGSCALLALGLVASAALVHRVTGPLSELSSAATAVGDGALGAQVEERGGREVEKAIGAFNRMSRRLETLDAESRALREREHLSELGEVARGLAHGLRNPLNALGLTVEELARGEGSRERAAEAARRQIRRIDGAIRSFLALATEGTSSATSEVDVAALAEDVVLEALQDVRGRVAIAVESDPGVPHVSGVAAELRSVIQSLVGNAVEASPDGGHVHVRVEPAGGSGARVVVDDEGPGVPDSVRARLFTPHVTTKPTGAGMGLFLAHRLAVVRHGGSLSLEPRDPSGTRATLVLTARDAGEPAGSPAGSATSGRSPGAPSRDAPVARPGRDGSGER